jgi:hypothetical protein
MRGRKAIQFAAAILAATLLLVLANWNTSLSINLEVESAISQGEVVIYFDDGTGYRQENAVGLKLMRGLRRYDFWLPTNHIKEFRIDPSTHDKSTRILTVEARSDGVYWSSASPAAPSFQPTILHFRKSKRMARA